MAIVLVMAGTVAAGLVGFGFGLLGLLVPEPTTRAIVGLTAAAIVLDVVRRRVPALRPPAVGRQVPIEWGRMFSPSVVALLYGSRLGVGPLTILSTWLWWSTMISAAMIGVGTSVTVAAVFGFVRLSSTVLASLRAEQVGHARWFGELRSRTDRAWLGIDAVAAAFVGVGAVML